MNLTIAYNFRSRAIAQVSEPGSAASIAVLEIAVEISAQLPEVLRVKL